MAVALRCPSASQAPLLRDYADIDLVALGSSRADTEKLLEDSGYVADREFNILQNGRRLLYWDTESGRQADIFVDGARLCHSFDFRQRLHRAKRTLPLADLLLMKLQVVETNRKDFLDICAILADHQLGEDEEEVDSGYIAELASGDWGLWRTLGLVAERAQTFATELEGFDGSERVVERLAAVVAAMEDQPKSRSWKLRARVGDRKRWYELPEEVH